MTDITTEDRPAGLAGVPLAIEPLKRRDFASDPVSYTHLTLPTICSV